LGEPRCRLGAVARHRRDRGADLQGQLSSHLVVDGEALHVPAWLTARFSGCRGPHLSRVRFPPFSRHNVPATPRQRLTGAIDRI
jgi:hypothetical protein